ncbi:class I SAM-dependent methyltransferase, partial [Klebsiella pneumoniae]
FVRSVVLRTQLFDRLTTQFLSAHPSGLCIALGAGLCTRRSRLAALAGTARWLNVDLPDAIALRDQYMDGDETRLACSILDT